MRVQNNRKWDKSLKKIVTNSYNSQRNMTQQKQISISILKIKNWQETQNRDTFEFHFFDRSGLIKSSLVRGLKRENQIDFDHSLRICYTSAKPTVTFAYYSKIELQMSHIIGRGGKVILGEFSINLETLQKNKKELFRFGKKEEKVLVISLYKKAPKKQQKTQSSSRQNVEQLYGLSQFYRKSNNNEDFIRQREQFLERHSNRSKASSRSSRMSQGLSMKHNVVKTQGDESTQKTYFDYYQQSSDSKNSISSRQSHRFSGVQRRSMMPENQRGSQRDTSVHSRRSNSQKYVLLVNSLNVVPREEYYSNKAKQITRESNSGKLPSNLTPNGQIFGPKGSNFEHCRNKNWQNEQHFNSNDYCL